MAKLRIKADHKTPFGAKIFLDEQELENIIRLNFSMDVQGYNRVEVEFICDEVEINAEAETKFTFRKGISK
jgi:hypothetical protein